MTSSGSEGKSIYDQICVVYQFEPKKKRNLSMCGPVVLGAVTGGGGGKGGLPAYPKSLLSCAPERHFSSAPSSRFRFASYMYFQRLWDLFPLIYGRVIRECSAADLMTRAGETGRPEG